MGKKGLFAIISAIVVAAAAAAALAVYLTKKLNGKGIAYIECNCNDEEEIIDDAKAENEKENNEEGKEND